MTDTAHPFMFYGPSPDDWFDEPVHVWLLRFVREPSPAQRASLAAAWEGAAIEAMRGLGANLRLPWWWSAEWALVQVRPGDRSRDTMRALFAAMQSMLRAAHAAAPIAEVAYAQAADVSTGSAWEAWTVERSPLPTEPPTWPAELVTHAKKSRKRTKAAVDDTFEAARARFRTGELSPSRPAVVAEDEPARAVSPALEATGEDEDESQDDEPEEASAPIELPKPRGVALRLEVVDHEAFEARVGEESSAASKSGYAQQLRDGTWCVRVKPSKRDKVEKLALRIDGELKTTAHPGDWSYSARSWSPERRELLVDDPGGKGLVTAGLDDASTRPAWSDEAVDGVGVALWLAGAVMFVGNSHGACAWRPSGDGFVAGTHHAWSTEQEQVATTPDRRGVVSVEGDEATVVRVVVPVDGVLRVAGEGCVETDGYASLEILPDGLYLHDGEHAWRVDGVHEAIEGLLASPGDTERFPALPTVTSPEERADPARNTNPHECYDRGVRAKEEADDPKAERWFRRAVELDPVHAMAWHGLGHVLQRMGRDPDGRACLERAVAVYDAQIPKDEDDPDELRFWRAAALSRLGRRDDTLAALGAVITAGTQGNWMRSRAVDEEDFAWLRKDPEFIALTTKVARPKKAKKTGKKPAEDDED